MFYPKADHLCKYALIQDIPTFNGSDSTQLEDWLVDIETAANLTDESRTKLAQAKPMRFNPHLDNRSSYLREVLGGNQGLTPFKNLQLRHPYFSKAASWTFNRRTRNL